MRTSVRSSDRFSSRSLACSLQRGPVSVANAIHARQYGNGFKASSSVVKCLYSVNAVTVGPVRQVNRAVAAPVRIDRLLLEFQLAHLIKSPIGRRRFYRIE